MENYKENLKSAKKWYKIAKEQNNQLAIDILEKYFPELAESKDERIRKAILELVKQSSHILNPMNQKSMISWLEKQGEQKSVCNAEPKPAWSEEDEKMLNDVIDTLHDAIFYCDVDEIGTLAKFCYEDEIRWLNSLKERLVSNC